MEFDLDEKTRIEIIEAIEHYTAVKYATDCKGAERLDSFCNLLEHCGDVGTTLHLN